MRTQRSYSGGCIYACERRMFAAGGAEDECLRTTERAFCTADTSRPFFPPTNDRLMTSVALLLGGLHWEHSGVYTSARYRCTFAAGGVQDEYLAPSKPCYIYASHVLWPKYLEAHGCPPQRACPVCLQRCISFALHYTRTRLFLSVKT